MATQKVKIVYVTDIKTRTVVKVTSAVCLTILGCRVAGDLSTPYIVKLTNKLVSMVGEFKDSPAIVAIVDEVPVEGATTVDE